MRTIILGINGVLCYDNPVWNTLMPAFLRYFPSAQCVVEEDTGLQLWQLRRMQRFMEMLCKKYDRPETKLILVGHSMGGLFASAIASRLQEAELAGVTTVCSPNSSVWMYPLYLGAARRFDAPAVSFGGARDRYVLYGTRHPRAVYHQTIDCDHYESLSRNRQVAEWIASVSAKHFA
jgi:pimeloyl-ACP methyl ester carboxylesterase